MIKCLFQLTWSKSYYNLWLFVVVRRAYTNKEEYYTYIYKIVWCNLITTSMTRLIIILLLYFFFNW